MPCDFSGSYDLRGEFYEITPQLESVKPIGSQVLSIIKVKDDIYRYEEFGPSNNLIVGGGTTSLEDDDVLIFSVNTPFGRQLIQVKALKCKKGLAEKIQIKSLTASPPSSTIPVILMIGKRQKRPDNLPSPI